MTRVIDTSKTKHRINLPGTRLSSSEVSGEPFDDPRGRWKTGGGINVPVQLTIKNVEAQSRGDQKSFEGTEFPRGATLAALCHEVEMTACSWLVTKMTRIKYTFTSFLFDLYFILVYTSCYKDSV